MTVGARAQGREDMSAGFNAVVWWVTCAFVLLICAPDSRAQDKPFSIPGTGITMVLPPDVALSPVGATLLDASGEVTITFSASEGKYNADEDPVWRGIYPRKAGKVEHLPQGKLRRRARAADGGDWDGLMLTAARDGRSLQVMLNYKGNSPEAFEVLRERLLTLTWNPAEADPELAMGVDFDFEGLKPVPGDISWITYTPDGEDQKEGTNVHVMPLPGPRSRDVATLFTNCEKILTAPLMNARHSPLIMKTLQTHSWCELWTEPVAVEGKYLALVRLETGGVLTLWGTTTPADFPAALPVFRRGVEEMRVLRAPAGN